MADTAPFSGPGNQYVQRGAAYKGGYVLVGEDAPVPSGTVAGVVWLSPDGQHWQRIPNTGGTFSEAEVQAVAASGSTLVAVGAARHADNAQDLTPPFGLAWVSSDGVSWRRVRDETQVLGGLGLRGVVAGPGGFLVWGTDRMTPGQPFAFATSTDGTHWVRGAPTGDVFAGGNIDSLIASRDGYAAVGFTGEVGPGKAGTAAAWWSADGRSWHASYIGPGYRVLSVEPWVDSLLARGLSGPGVGPPFDWISSDGGRTWRPRSPQVSGDRSLAPQLLVDGQVVRFYPNVFAEWTSDGTTWHPLAMTGASLDQDAGLDIAKGQTILSFRSVTSPKATAHDQVDARVWIGALR